MFGFKIINTGNNWFAIFGFLWVSPHFSVTFCKMFPTKVNENLYGIFKKLKNKQHKIDHHSIAENLESLIYISQIIFKENEFSLFIIYS